MLMQGARPLTCKNMNDPEFSRLMAASAVLLQYEDWPAARGLLLRALLLAETEVGSHHPSLLPVLEPLIRCHGEEGDHHAAEELRHRAITISLNSKIAKGRERADLYNDYASAETLFTEALLAAESHFGRRHRETATVLTNLGSCVRSQGRFHKALELIDEGLSVRRDILGANHPNTAQSLCEKGKTLRMAGKFKEAEAPLLESLRIRKLALGCDHPEVAESVNALAGLYREQGRFEEALPLAQEALSIRTDSLGPDHELTAASKNNLALVLLRERTPKRANREPKSKPIKRNFLPHLKALLFSLPLLLLPPLLLFLPPTVRNFVLLSLCALMSLIVSVMTFVYLVKGRSWDDQMRRVFNRLKAAMREDEERTNLGMLIPHQEGVTLDAANARKMRYQDPLILNHLSGMSREAAAELSAHIGRLELNGLSSLPSKIARPLRKHRGTLLLNGVRELSVAAAAHIARHLGDLYLDGISELTPELASHLCVHKGGMLSLNGVKYVGDEVAELIVQHRGRVRLGGIKMATPKALQILRTGNFILPEGLGEL